MKFFDHMLYLIRQMGQNAIFQDDNARPHRARIVVTFCDRMVFNGLSGHQSRDLSCIEHLWNILGGALNKPINQQTRLADLQRLLLQEWAVIPQIQIQRLVNSIRRRLNQCQVNHGGDTHYEATDTVILSFLTPNHW